VSEFLSKEKKNEKKKLEIFFQLTAKV